MSTWSRGQVQRGIEQMPDSREEHLTAQDVWASTEGGRKDQTRRGALRADARTSSPEGCPPVGYAAGYAPLMRTLACTSGKQLTWVWPVAMPWSCTLAMLDANNVLVSVRG